MTMNSTAGSHLPDDPAPRLVPETPPNQDSGSLSLRTLERRYTGFHGTKVFWLATLTLAPLLITTKLGVAYQLSLAALCFFLPYHLVGILVYGEVNQLVRFGHTYLPDERMTISRRLCWMDRFVRVWSYPVFALIALQLMALVAVGDKRLVLPRCLYDLVNVVPPPVAYEEWLGDAAATLSRKGEAPSDLVAAELCRNVTRWAATPDAGKSKAKLLSCIFSNPLPGYEGREAFFEAVAKELNTYESLTPGWRRSGEHGRLEQYWAHPASGLSVTLTLWVDTPRDESPRALADAKAAGRNNLWISRS